MKQTVLLLAAPIILAATFAAAQQREPLQYDAGQIADLAKEMNRMKSTNWQDGFNFGQELAGLPSPVGYEILRDNWNKGASLVSREQMFKGFVFNKHPDTLLVLNLGMHDPHVAMQARAMSYLSEFAFRDFNQDFASYFPWFEKYKALPFSAVAKASLRDRLDELMATSAADLESVAESVSAGLARSGDSVGRDAIAEALGSFPKGSALYERLEGASADKPGCTNLMIELLQWGLFDSDKTDRCALKLLGRKDVLSDPGAIAQLGKIQSPRIDQALLQVVAMYTEQHLPGMEPILQALADCDDAKAFRGLFDLIPTADADHARAIEQVIGNTLRLESSESRDAAWWTRWVEKNKIRFNQQFDPRALPDFKVEAIPTQDYIPNADDVKDIPDKSYQVGDDKMKRYIVSGTFDDGSPKKVLVVMPGGSGDIQFHPFVKRILKYALDPGWVIVEPIAPPWSADENRVVWPSVATHYQPAKFTIEEFLDGMIDELTSKVNLKTSGIYILGWSSSGPAIYSYLAHGKHTLDGAFIAMSIFNRGLIGDAAHLNAKRIYILHSPQDFIPIAQAKQATDTVSGMGIPVKMETYQGGHGWNGPVYQMIGDGIKFLTGG